MVYNLQFDKESEMYAQTALKPNPLLRNGAYGIVMRGVQKMNTGVHRYVRTNYAPLCCIKLDTATEATSNVDAHTEQVIQEAMATLMKGRTSFVIAHRLSTIRDANVILYMENGDIKEVGDHDTLMRLNGKYAVLYNSQFG